MSTRQERYKMAEILVQDVSKLLKTFIQKMGLPMEVKLMSIIESSKEVYMEDVEALVVACLPAKYREKGLRSKSRKLEFILYKHVMLYILRKKGFGSSEIANFFDMRHSDVIYAYKKIKNHLFTEDLATLDLYTRLLTLIDKKITIRDRFTKVSSGK